MKNWFRVLVAVWYLLGWILHVYLGLANPEIYRAFGETALLPGFDLIWQGFVMTRITAFALVLAAFQLAVGLMLIGKRKWVKLGLVLSIGFNLFLIQLGLSIPAEDLSMDIYFNRFPNIVFVLLQAWLLFQTYPETIYEMIRRNRESGKQ